MPTEVPILLARQDDHLQYLIHGHHQRAACWVEEQGETAPELAAWLAAYLKLPIRPTWVEHLTPADQQQWKGWRQYYAGELEAAAGLFHDAWEMLADPQGDRRIATDTALGLGKVYTRTGHWATARAWLLKALQLARDGGRQFDIIRGYGALGELLLRAGYPREAHACMSTSYHLLPPGSGQQARQLNYLASTLMRSGAALRAESLLMTSLFMATDQGDTDSRWHALARLQFLRLGTQAEESQDVLQTLAAYVPDTFTPAATGFALLGRALLHWDRDRDTAAQALQEAGEHFGPALPMEQAWARRLLSTATQSAYTPSARVLRYINLTPRAPAVSPDVLDHSWASSPIDSTNGFQWLASAPDSAELSGILEQRCCFFI